MIVINYFIILNVWIVSHLPFWFVYLLSDINRFFVYRVFRYRRAVVYQNLKNSFPEKNERERKKIEKLFYKNFCDQIMEIVKLRGITQKQLLKRTKFNNKEILERLYNEGRSIIAVTGHIGNWEWAGMVLQFHTKHKVFALVKPLSSRFFENYIHRLRTRFSNGEGLIPFKSAFRVLVKHRNESTITLIASDQTPTKSEIEYWTPFLNQETPVFLGIEKMAKSLDSAILYFPIRRIKRGYYEIDISIMTENPKEEKEFAITENHVRYIESFIRKYPDNWLWSHRRWKHKKE